MAFGYYFFGGPSAGGPVNVPPPVPKIGDIWAYKDGDNPDVKLGQLTKIVLVTVDGIIDSVDVDSKHTRMWGSHEMFWAGWRLHTSVDTAAQLLEKAKKIKARYPHKCPRCAHPAYIGGGPSDIDCHNDMCSTKNNTLAFNMVT